MAKKIVVSFTGGRGYEIPILYFGAKHYEDLGYEKLLISHLDLEDFSFEAILENAENIINKIDFKEYEDIVFIGKCSWAPVKMIEGRFCWKGKANHDWIDSCTFKKQCNRKEWGNTLEDKRRAEAI